MTSKISEKKHLENLKRLLEERDLLGPETPIISTISEHSAVGEEFTEEYQFEGLHEDLAFEIREEEVAEEAKKDEEKETLPVAFPSPSLRRVIPDRLRQIEEFNTIHTLPESFNLQIQPDSIPKIKKTLPRDYIDKLAELLGCEEYGHSMAEFWFLDTLANLLRRAQEDGMDRVNQTILIHWFCEFMQEIHQFDAANRLRMMRRFQNNVSRAARSIHDGVQHVPTPREIGIIFKASQMREEPKWNQLYEINFRNASYRSNVKNLTRIIHYIYDVFSTEFQYKLIRSVFTMKPEYKDINAPHRLNIPAQGLLVEKVTVVDKYMAKATEQKKTKKGK